MKHGTVWIGPKKPPLQKKRIFRPMEYFVEVRLDNNRPTGAPLAKYMECKYHDNSLRRRRTTIANE
jgi:hypothetical protein